MICSCLTRGYLALQTDILPGVGDDAADALRDESSPEELHRQLRLVTAVHVGGDAGDGAGGGDGVPLTFKFDKLESG